MASEALREMTYEEMIANTIMNILAIDVAFGVKRDMIGQVLNLSYKYESDVKNALYTQTPSCTIMRE